jgi:hypothetical protein
MQRLLLLLLSSGCAKRLLLLTCRNAAESVVCYRRAGGPGCSTKQLHEGHQ